jgi:hypothetical protein
MKNYFHTNSYHFGVVKVRKYTPFTPQWEKNLKFWHFVSWLRNFHKNLSENFYQMIYLFYLCVLEWNYFQNLCGNVSLCLKMTEIVYHSQTETVSNWLMVSHFDFDKMRQKYFLNPFSTTKIYPIFKM